MSKEILNQFKLPFRLDIDEITILDTNGKFVPQYIVLNALNHYTESLKPQNVPRRCEHCEGSGWAEKYTTTCGWCDGEGTIYESEEAPPAVHEGKTKGDTYFKGCKECVGTCRSHHDCIPFQKLMNGI